MTFPTPEIHARHRRSSRARLAAPALLVGLAAGLTGCGGDDSGEAGTVSERQAAVAERGAQIMPFDLDATTHHFEPTDDGLVQTVTADDPDDGEQVRLIREHLTHEADQFRQGDLGGPATIHGDDMPGLAELESGATTIHIEYNDVEAGARITYTTDAPELIDALHRWGEAQVTDHGDHAELGSSDQAS